MKKDDKITEKKNKVFKIFGLIGICSSILSLIIMIVTWKTVNRIEEMVDTSKDWIMKLELIEPQDGSRIIEPVDRIKGKFEFYTTAAEAYHKDRVNLAMHQKSIELLCYVKNISNFNTQNNYYHLSRPVVLQNGDFDGLVSYGYLSEDDFQTRYQIIVLAVPKNFIPKGLIHDVLPFYLAASNVVVVKGGGQGQEIER